jgi:hypothetical protein
MIKPIASFADSLVPGVKDIRVTGALAPANGDHMLKGPPCSLMSAKVSYALNALAETYEGDERCGANSRETATKTQNTADRPFTFLDSGANYVVSGSAQHFAQISKFLHECADNFKLRRWSK